MSPIQRRKSRLKAFERLQMLMKHKSSFLVSTFHLHLSENPVIHWFFPILFTERNLLNISIVPKLVPPI